MSSICTGSIHTHFESDKDAVNARFNDDGKISFEGALKEFYDLGARKFRLEQLGQTKAIQYEYLIDCINTDRWLFEDGLVYINDPQVVEEQLLEEEYKKFLTSEKIQNILTFDTETIKEMVSKATKAIQETICSVVIDKINAGESIDLNKVYAIGNSCEPQVNLLELSQKIK